MSRWLARWRLALRLARRDALRHRGRSLLVLAMVGLPVLAVVAADTLYRTHDISAVEALPATLGAADARLTGDTHAAVYADPVTGDVLGTPGADPQPVSWSRAEVAAALPPGSRVVQAVAGEVTYRTAGGYAAVTGRADDLSDPIRAGAYQVLAGRVPGADGEVAVSRAIAAGGIGVGDRLALTRDDVPFRVVGVLDTNTAGNRYLLLPPSAARLLNQPSSVFYATVPGGLAWPAVHALNRQGLVAVSRTVVTDPPPAAAYQPPGTPPSTVSSATVAVLALIVASVLIEVVLLAGPAFAVGVRRQRRDLALLAATGGSPADLRRVVLASGLVLGGGAAVLGAGLGIGLFRLVTPLIKRWTTLTLGPFDVAPLDVALTVAVGVLAGLAAAYVPARQAARTDVIATLTGRRGQVRTSWRSPVLGLTLAAAGLVAVVLGARGSAVAVALGAVVLVLGVVAACPWLVGLLAPLARRLPVSGVLAVRDATRNRTRTAPAIAAVMATVTGVTALAIGSASDAAKTQRDYVPQAPMGAVLVRGALDQPGWDTVAALLADQAPGRAVHRLEAARSTVEAQRDLAVTQPGCTGSVDACSWSPGAQFQLTTISGAVVVADADTVRALTSGPVAADITQVLAQGRVAVLGAGALDSQGDVRLTGFGYDPSGTATVLGQASLPATEIALPRDQTVTVPGFVVVPPALAGRLPIPVSTSQLLAGGPGDPVTPAQQERVQERVTALSPSASVYVERGWTDTSAVARAVLFALGAVLVLIAVFTATGLTLTDARPDFATLAAIGAAPGVRRRMAMGSAAVIGISGAVLGVLVGLAPGIAVAHPLTDASYGAGNSGAVVVIPWTTLAGVAIAVPLLAVAVTGLAVRSRLPMTRRTT